MKATRVWEPTPNRKSAHRQRFKIIPFVNPSGARSWRVTGVRRDGVQVRENFRDLRAAQCKQVELETEWLGQQTDTSLRATKLTETQLRVAEVAFVKLGHDSDHDLVLAVEHWLRQGKQGSSAESPRLDDAIDQYLEWLAVSTLRDATKRHWRTRMTVFKNSVPNLRVVDVTPETMDRFLATRKTSPSSKDTDRRAVSRFFSWCIERPRRWLLANPCREVRVERGEAAAPTVLSVEDCGRLLNAAEAHKSGLLAPYVAVCLFAGLRPFEAARLQWSQVNLADGEIRLEANQTKTRRARVVKICDPLNRWLSAYHGTGFFPANWRKEFDAVRARAKIADWTADVMRHTAVSHFFRATGSYGRTAEQFGNSETIIKNHYQGRVSSDEAERIYQLLPTK